MTDNISRRILIALDFRDAETALRLVDQLDPSDCGLKVGKELFTAAGPLLVRQLVARGFPVFLDLKFHDIPNTVAGAVSAAADLGVWMINVHASGGRAMMESARKALDPLGVNRPLLTAVTVLTSFSADSLREVGVARNLQDQVDALSCLAQESGMDGVVCSAQEAPLLRKKRRSGFLLVTPGIRPLSAARDDQQRVVTPREALQQGSDYLVVGRPITHAANPLHALRTILEEISYT